MPNLSPAVRVLLAGSALLVAAATSTPGYAADKEKFVYGLSWLPEAEHCGLFFQAKARGLYDAAGLDVEIMPGAPGMNIPQMVSAGRLDAGMGSAMTTLNMRANGADGVTIAAFLQKNPQTLVAHPDPSLQKLEDLKTRKIAVGNAARNQFWLWLKAKYGFQDEQLRPYNYNPAGFVADETMVQQGYITEDEVFLGKAIGKIPKSFLLADYGYKDYASTVFTMASVIEKKRDALQRFIDASVKGWNECMHGDPQPAFEALKAADPQQTFELSAFKVAQMKKFELVDGGAAASLGAGAMSDDSWKSVFEFMAEGGAYPKTLDYRQAYTLDFIHKKPSQ